MAKRDLDLLHERGRGWPRLGNESEESASLNNGGLKCPFKLASDQDNFQLRENLTDFLEKIQRVLRCIEVPNEQRDAVLSEQGDDLCRLFGKDQLIPAAQHQLECLT